MKKVFFSKRSKLIVDILLIAALILMIVHTGPATGTDWMSYHCIMGMVSVVFMTIHIRQHWPFIKVLFKKQVIRKNIITALTTVSFLLIFVSILLLAIGFKIPLLRFHNVVGHLFILLVIIHLISRFKRFLYLFK